jgi:class 3 adenylate cyclase/tetratricopeptide (TPR) repeat protein
MAACPQCGEENPSRAKFCLACGVSLAAAAEREVRKTVTVLFSDLVGSTELGERLDPESIRQLMSRYFEEMQGVLQRHGGTVQKFIGDAIMAVFGIPTVHEDDALRAVRAAAEMRERLRVLNEEIDRRWRVRLQVRTGINTGEVVAGDSSPGQSVVLGDPVNVAARLEQAAAPGEILLGERTRSLAGGAIDAEPITALTLKGKSEALPAWRLIDVKSRVATPRGRSDSPFLGRTEEYQALGRAFERAIDERICVLATIVGPPGIGKSRLVGEFTQSVGQDSRVVSGHCLPYGEGITFWPLAEIVNEVGAGDLPRLVEKVIGDDAGVIAERIAAATGSAESPGSPAEIFWAFRKLFEALARERPLIVVVDDIHWAEPTLLDLLEYMIEFASDAPILLLCLARAELFESRPSWAVPRRNASLIPLQPISKSDATTLIDRLTTHEFPQAARARVAEAAEGNPLFIEQLLALNADVNATPGAILVPPTIDALLAARIDRLESADRAVIERAAIEGRTFHRGAVVELLDADARAKVGACLISLARKEFIQPDRALFTGDDAFRFVHILIRDAAYEAMPKQLRARLHERFAIWLEGAAGEHTADYEEILAYHLEQAYRYQAELGRPDEAGRLAQQAGNRLGVVGLRALARGDMPAAIGLLTRATKILPADDPARIQLLPELGTALVDAGELTRAETVLQEAIDRAQAGGNQLARWRATVTALGLKLWTRRAEIEEVLPLAEAAAAASAQLGDELALARAWHVVGLARVVGTGRGSDEAFQKALGHARRADAPREESAALMWLLISAWFGPTPAAEGIRRCREILQQPITRTVEAMAGIELGCFLASQGQFDEARSSFARGHALLEDLGQRLHAAGTSQEFFDLEMLAGNPATAEQRLRRACEALEQLGEKAFLPTRLGCLAEAIYAQGHFAEAEQMSRKAEAAAATDPSDFDAQFRWRAVLGKALAQRGEFDAGEAMVRAAAKLIERTDWLSARAGVEIDLAEILILAGQDAEALPHLEAALRLFEEKENQVAAAKVRARLTTLQRTLLGRQV